MRGYNRKFIIKSILAFIIISLMFNVLINKQHISQAEETSTKCAITVEKTKEEGVIDWCDITQKQNVNYNYKVIIKITSQDALKGIQFKAYFDAPSRIVAATVGNYFDKNEINFDTNKLVLYNEESTKKTEAPNQQELCTLYMFVPPAMLDTFDMGFDFSKNADFESIVLKNDETRYQESEIKYPKRNVEIEDSNDEDEKDDKDVEEDKKEPTIDDKEKESNSNAEKTPSNSEISENNGANNSNSPKAGDNIILYISFFSIGMLIFSIMFIKKMKNKGGKK
ncbi:MAG: hypothetical protein J6A89_04570 [Clostridia bacterium]|nr:hypothetical protein [Clostridia bacterium]